MDRDKGGVGLSRDDLQMHMARAGQIVVTWLARWIPHG